MTSFQKELDDFKKRFSANSAVTAEIADSRKRNSEAVTDAQISKPKRLRVDPLTKDNYASVSGSSSNAFAVLAKIVNHLKNHHQRGFHHPLDLEEILEETKQYSVSARIKHWLATEALKNNVKVEVIGDKHYIYKPEYKIKGTAGLSSLLQKQFSEEIGAISMESIEESLPSCRKILQGLSSSIVVITRPDKKEFVFSKVVGMATQVDEESFKKFWRSSSVEGLSEAKISEFLQQHNIHSFGSSESNHFMAPKTKTKSKRNSKKPKELKHNAHVAGDIIDYDKE